MFAGLEGLRGFFLEGGGRGEEGLSVFIRGGVVDVFLSGQQAGCRVVKIKSIPI